MVWTTVPDKAASATISEGDWDTYIRDNAAECAPAIVTTAGDIVYADGANSLTRLALGTADDILVAGGSAPAWQSPHACRLRNTSSQTPSTSTWDDVAFSTTDYDLGSMRSVNQIVCQSGGSGIYHIQGMVEFGTSGQTSGTNTFGLRILLNDTTTLAVARFNVSFTSPGTDINLSVSTDYELDGGASDYVELQCWTSLACDINASGNYTPVFSAHFIRRP